jgi:hypothetical protein
VKCQVLVGLGKAMTCSYAVLWGHLINERKNWKHRRILCLWRTLIAYLSLGVEVQFYLLTWTSNLYIYFTTMIVRAPPFSHPSPSPRGHSALTYQSTYHIPKVVTQKFEITCSTQPYRRSAVHSAACSRKRGREGPRCLCNGYWRAWILVFFFNNNECFIVLVGSIAKSEWNVLYLSLFRFLMTIRFCYCASAILPTYSASRIQHD